MKNTNKHKVYRNAHGQFARKPSRKVYRLNNGQFTSKPANTVVSGRLYDFKGTVVRAGHMVNGKRLVIVHKTLFGFVNDCQLKKVDASGVENYLAHA